MSFLRALGRFLGPWLAFAALSGLLSGFVLGTFVSLIGLVAGVFTLAGGVAGGTSLQAATEVVKAFPDFALGVLATVTFGFASGFLAGSFAAPVGGLAGFWWSFLIALGAVGVVYPAYMPRGCVVDPTVPMALVMGTCGALFPPYLLAPNARKFPFFAPIQQFLSESWIPNPPQRARIAGLLLPILLYGIWEIATVGPEFVQHQNYAARVGIWERWQNSKRMARPQRGMWGARSQCQTNLKQIVLAVKQYTADYDDLYPPAPKSAANGTGVVLQPYMKSTQLFQCPQEFYAPQNAAPSSGDFTDYWFNARFYGLTESAISDSGNSIICGDGNTGAGEANAAYSLQSVPPNWAPSLRHIGGANYAFADGHVKWLLPRKFSNSAAPNGSNFTMMP